MARIGVAGSGRGRSRSRAGEPRGDRRPRHGVRGSALRRRAGARQPRAGEVLPDRRPIRRRPPPPHRRSPRVISPVRWDGERLMLLDQTRLPTQEIEHACRSWRDVAEAIRSLVVRGAPAIGITAAFGVALAARESQADDFDALLTDLEEAIKGLGNTRPTAVNLFWALARMRRVALAHRDRPLGEIESRLLAEAQTILDEDIAANRAMGAHGAELVPEGGRVLTHCNAGALATGGYGTALGVIRSAVDSGKKLHVFADETRPFLQGLR